MRPNKAQTAVHGCHCPDNVAVRVCKALARPWVGVPVESLAFIVVQSVNFLFYKKKLHLIQLIDHHQLYFNLPMSINDFTCDYSYNKQ